jgi:hypothetical protein
LSADLLWVLGIVAAWLLLQRVVLPRLGVPT